MAEHTDGDAVPTDPALSAENLIELAQRGRTQVFADKVAASIPGTSVDTPTHNDTLKREVTNVGAFATYPMDHPGVTREIDPEELQPSESGSRDETPFLVAEVVDPVQAEPMHLPEIDAPKTQTKRNLITAGIIAVVMIIVAVLGITGGSNEDAASNDANGASTDTNRKNAAVSQYALSVFPPCDTFSVKVFLSCTTNGVEMQVLSNATSNCFLDANANTTVKNEAVCDTTANSIDFACTDSTGMAVGATVAIESVAHNCTSNQFDFSLQHVCSDSKGNIDCQESLLCFSGDKTVGTICGREFLPCTNDHCDLGSDGLLLNGDALESPECLLPTAIDNVMC